ncbi:MAG: hypothetical protein FJY85_12410 [Deltaproteobacteria bacterium]|nr:hypothetical protein [Deltaproteobacteria bacterium]
MCNTNHKLLNLEGEVTLVTAVEYDMVKKLYVLDIDAVYAKGLLEPGPGLRSVRDAPFAGEPFIFVAASGFFVGSPQGLWLSVGASSWRSSAGTGVFRRKSLPCLC